MEEAQAVLRQFTELLSTLPDRLRDIETLNSTSRRCMMPTSPAPAVSAVDAATWQIIRFAELLLTNQIHSHKRANNHDHRLNCDLGEGWRVGNGQRRPMIELATSVNIRLRLPCPAMPTSCADRGAGEGARRQHRRASGLPRPARFGAVRFRHEAFRDREPRRLPDRRPAGDRDRVGHKVTHVKAHGALSNGRLRGTK